MRKSLIPSLLLALLAAMPGLRSAARAQTAMAPLGQYLMPSPAAEIALARSAAPPAISSGAEIMVLGRNGYTTVAPGGNGFLCLVERSWGAATTDPVFWNPRIRGPICFNPAAARTVVPVYLMKTQLVLAGKSKAELVQALAAAFWQTKLPPLEPGAMCYMLSKQQYLNDQAHNWHPHLMFYARGDAAKSWGADLPGSPIIASPVPEERMTVLMVLVGAWSDGTPAR